MLVANSAFVKFLTNVTGLPAQTVPAGISLPGGTTELAAIKAPLSILAPSRITLPYPIVTSS